MRLFFLNMDLSDFGFHVFAWNVFISLKNRNWLQHHAKLSHFNPCVLILYEYFSSPGWNSKLSGTSRVWSTGLLYTAVVNNHFLPFRNGNFKAGLWLLFAKIGCASALCCVTYEQLLNPKIKNALQILGSPQWAGEPWRLLDFKRSYCPTCLSPTQWTYDDRNEVWFCKNPQSL